jgi:hypothetical protein
VLGRVAQVSRLLISSGIIGRGTENQIPGCRGLRVALRAERIKQRAQEVPPSEGNEARRDGWAEVGVAHSTAEAREPNRRDLVEGRGCRNMGPKEGTMSGTLSSGNVCTNARIEAGRLGVTVSRGRRRGRRLPRARRRRRSRSRTAGAHGRVLCEVARLANRGGRGCVRWSGDPRYG